MDYKGRCLFKVDALLIRGQALTKLNFYHFQHGYMFRKFIILPTLQYNEKKNTALILFLYVVFTIFRRWGVLTVFEAGC